MIRPRIKPHVIWMPGYIIPDKALPFIPKSQESIAGRVESESYALIKRAMHSSFWAIQKQGK